jgi:RNA polymerase sigma-70 factor (ECF subfamily)
MRYCGAEESSIRSPRAFAATIVTPLCLDHLRSARAAREEFIGPWLPEPILTSEVNAFSATPISSRISIASSGLVISALDSDNP